MAGWIRRGMAGLGGAAERSGFAMLQSSLEEQRQTRLMELRQRHETAAQERGFQHAEAMQGKGFEHAENLQREGFKHSEGLESGRQSHAERLQETALEAAAKRHSESLAVQREGQGIQRQQLDILKKGAGLDHDIKTIQLGNAKRVDALQKEFATAAPDRKQAIRQEISILTGKDNNRFLPVPLKDELGNITGYQIFDKVDGVFVSGGKPQGASGEPSARPPLSQFFGGQAAPQGGGSTRVPEPSAPTDTGPLTAADLQDIESQPTPAAKTQRRNELIRQRRAEQSSGSRIRDFIAADEEEEAYRLRGEGPEKAYFGR